MAEYILTNQAKEDLIRIYHYGTKRFGVTQADKYYENFFNHFKLIAQQPYLFESVDFIKSGYRRCVCGVDSIFFRNNNGVIEIMTIIGRQELEQLL